MGLLILISGKEPTSFFFFTKSQDRENSDCNKQRHRKMSAIWRSLLRHSRAAQPWRSIPSRSSSSSSSPANLSSAVNSMLLRSLKEHYLDVSKMNPPPKVSPPPGFTVLKGALDGNEGPVLTKSYGNEEIKISVMRLSNIIPGGGGGGGDDEEDINQLFLHVEVSKPDQHKSLHFLCGLYPDALGIHSVSLRPKLEASGFFEVPSSYNGPVFGDLDQKMRDAFHDFVDERGVNENLFAFLQAWLYVKDHKNLLRWFKAVGSHINEKPVTDA